MTQAALTYSRPLSGMERYSLALNEVYRYNVVAVVEGSGSIDECALRAAVNSAAAANPGVRVRLKYFLGFSRWVDSGIAPLVHVRNAGNWDYRSEHGAGFIHDRFDALNGGPIADIYLVIGEKICVVFRALHAAMDGGGMSHWMAEVFRALRGDSLSGSQCVLADFDVARRYRTHIKKAANKTNPSNAAQSICYFPGLPISAKRDVQLRYVWRVVRIPKQIYNILPRLAAFLCQYARRYTDGQIGFTVPVDWRGLRIDANSTANLTGYLRIQLDTTDTPRSVMQNIARQIRDHVDCQAPLNALSTRWIGVRRLAKKLDKNIAHLLYEANTYLPTAGLVSLGKLDIHSYDAPGFCAEQLVGIPGSVGKLNIVAAVMPTETVLTLSTPANYNHEGQVDDLARTLAEAFSQ